MKGTHIRKVEIADLEELQAIAQKTFRESFAGFNSKENMQFYLDNNLGKTQLQKELLKSDSEFYFCCNTSDIIGYIKINYEATSSDHINSQSIELERIYILHLYQRMGMGQLLLNHAILLAQKVNTQLIWLGVWEHNNKAISFYQKNGFEAFGQKVFMLGEDHQNDLLMRLKLL